MPAARAEYLRVIVRLDLISRSCTNCRRRKTKCDGARPICDQCVKHPPRSMAPCDYTPLPLPHSQETPTQMLATIGKLKERIEELEALVPDLSRVYLTPPYGPYPASGQGSSAGSSPLSSPNIFDEEPSPSITSTLNLVDSFLKHFTPNSYFFFLDGTAIRDSVESGVDSSAGPSATLLNAICLWGCLLTKHTELAYATPELFLQSAIRSLPQALGDVGGHPKLALDVLQAEILISFYFLHAGSVEQGRYHCAAATSLAIGPQLHGLRGGAGSNQYPVFPLLDTGDHGQSEASWEAQGMKAFWAVVILNNYWVAVDGCPSMISDVTMLQAGSTVTRFLDNSDCAGFAPRDMLAKSSILLERVVAFSNRVPDPVPFASLDSRLLNFQASLPSMEAGGQILLLIHALTDLAIIRLHARYTWTSVISRHKSLAAAIRIASGVENGGLFQTEHPDPMFAPIYATIAAFLVAEISALSNNSSADSDAPAELRDSKAQFVKVMNALAFLALRSPAANRCFQEIQKTYDAVSR